MELDSCRVCLCSDEDQLVELFWVDDDGVTLVDKVTFCSGVEVTSSKFL